jgi:hypothetical protein
VIESEGEIRNAKAKNKQHKQCGESTQLLRTEFFLKTKPIIRAKALIFVWYHKPQRVFENPTGDAEQGDDLRDSDDDDDDGDFERHVV